MVTINSKIKRGSAELAILALLTEQPLHGYEIAKRIDQGTGGLLRFNLASLYPLLYRLEKRGWVKGNWEASGGGRRRRYYRLTPAGEKQFGALRKQWRLYFRALNCLAGVAHA